MNILMKLGGAVAIAFAGYFLIHKVFVAPVNAKHASEVQALHTQFNNNYLELQEQFSANLEEVKNSFKESQDATRSLFLDRVAQLEKEAEEREQVLETTRLQRVAAAKPGLVQKLSNEATARNLQEIQEVLNEN